MKNNKPVFLVLLFMVACNTTKHIPEGEYLLDRVDVQMDDRGMDKAALMPYIQQQPNASKVGLGIYNLVRNDSGWVKKIVRKIGEPPVLFNSHLVTLSVNELNMQMRNTGYLQSTVSARVDTMDKKAVVSYLIHNGEPYRIRNYTLDLPQLQMYRSVDEAGQLDSVESNSRRSQRMRRSRPLIEEGAVFDLNVLEKERERVCSQLRNRGYYTFTEDNLHYLVDTALHFNQVDLTMILTDSTEQMVPYTVQRVNVFSGYDPLAREEYQIVDSLNYDGLHIYYDDAHFLRPRVIREKVLVRPGQLYNERQGESTYGLLQALGSMGRVDMQYNNNSNYSDSTLLDCNIFLTPGNNHLLQAGLEGTNKAGDLGVAVDITYGNLNFFNGSETFNIRLRGAYEFVGRHQTDDALLDNYYELGISPSLTFPQLHLPLINAYLEDRYKAKTQYSLGYNIQRRSEYVRNFFNVSWKFSWSSLRNKLSQTLSLVDINYVNMPWQSDKFREYLQNDVDLLTKNSYNNVFTAGIAYNLIYTNVDVGRMRQRLYTIRFGAESSGNMLGWIFDAVYAHQQKERTGPYDIFGNPFAQYVKGNIDFAETFPLDENNSLAFHAGAGVAYPYKNSSILPFEKRYYGGGPNNVRGWHTRYLGPGSFQGKKGDPTTHVGDISLIVSAEYRFRLLQWLEPAFFIDAGNIWTINDYAAQPGGLFRWDTFYREIAVGTGIGLRFDFKFLVFRLDAGTQVYDPAAGRSVFFRGRFFDHSAVHVAIGYPF
jgi:outer membrane protein assembly factor BamA